MTSKKTSALRFWVPCLLNPTTYSAFANVFTHFAHISTDFSRIFTKSKFMGVGLHPLNPRLLHHVSHPNVRLVIVSN